jgi:hypothetical protein
MTILQFRHVRAACRAVRSILAFARLHREDRKRERA